MRPSLLLFISTLLMLFTLAQPGTRVNSFSCVKQSELTAATKYTSHPVKRKCSKKCLRHKTHSEQQNAANVATDCSQQFYAIVANTQPASYFSSGVLQKAPVTGDKKHLSPSLAADPDPPRLS